MQVSVLNPSVSPGQPGVLRRMLRSEQLRPFNDPQGLDALLGAVNPTWSVRQIRARVVAVIAETADTRTFVLRPNRHWRGFRAGQHVAVEVEIDGVRHHRCYSLSSAPQRTGLISLTVKRQPASRVASWLHEHGKPGLVLALSAAAGQFGLPESTPARLLLISAGSGITPVMSVLRALHQRGYTGHIVFLHTCRTEQDLIFGAELNALAREWPSLSLRIHHSAVAGRLDATELARRVPDALERTTLLCGPSPFMEWVRALYAAGDASARLHCEDFRGRVLPRTRNAGDPPLEIRCVQTERSFTAAGAQALLVEAEAAGLTPRHGCRMGICRTCQCRKRSGSVENLLTGQICSEPDQLIQLCISAARSDLELVL